MLMHSRPSGAVSNSFLRDFPKNKIQIFSSLSEVDEIQFKIKKMTLNTR